jgi:hypothetical protein
MALVSGCVAQPAASIAPVAADVWMNARRVSLISAPFKVDATLLCMVRVPLLGILMNVKMSKYQETLIGSRRRQPGTAFIRGRTLTSFDACVSAREVPRSGVCHPLVMIIR